ncbi:MAG: MATE family efflux transporter [Eubacteriales bacterium]|nr:MATE family efflux transporter [Eubacteriales bacterium]MDD3197885.1 MATE family efflux transporter [Eubacteriales bacterium]MDD3503924.1 MATE family efflux transporter [Eubacteriales bacterium]MDD4683035.1 MATE family efflux transporter [Eubacteriales bacterium]
MKKDDLMTNMSTGKTILHASVPAMITILVMMIYNMADMFFIGKLGDPMQIAAVALVGPVMSILSGLGTLVGSGGCAAIATELGKKNLSRVRQMSSFSMYASVGMGLIFTISVFLFQQPILRLIGTTANTKAFAGIYLSIIALGAPIMTYASASANIVRAEGAVRESMLGNMLGSIVNIILDPIFILVLDLGVAGAAIATILGNLSAAIFFTIFFKYRSRNLTVSPRSFTLHPSISVKVLSLGLPTAIGVLLVSFSSILKNNLVVGYGDTVIAAMGVAGKTTMIVGMLQMGLAMGIQPVIAYNFGAKNFERMAALLKRTAFITVILGSALTIAVLIGRSSFIRFFIDDAAVIAYGQKIVLISVLTGPIAGINYISTMFLQATDKASHATLVSVLRQGLFFLPTMYTLNYFFALDGLLISQPLADIAATILGLSLMLLRYREIRGTRKLFFNNIFKNRKGEENNIKEHKEEQNATL